MARTRLATPGCLELAVRGKDPDFLLGRCGQDTYGSDYRLVLFCQRLCSDDRGPEVGTISVLEGWVADIPVWVWSLCSEEERNY